jgi:thiol-disulfide isomerase/thioredoxin
VKKLIIAMLAIFTSGLSFAQGYEIKGKITGFQNGTKFYLYDISTEANIDSTTIQNGTLLLKGSFGQTPKQLWLKAYYKQNFYYCNLLIGNEKISISGDITQFPTDISINGSKSQDDFNTQTRLTKHLFKQRADLVNQYLELKNDSGKVKTRQIWTVIHGLDSTDKQIRKDFIKTHPNSYAALIDLFYYRDEYPRDTLLKIYQSLIPKVKASVFGQRMITYLKIGNVLKKGDTMVSFSGIDVKGKQHQLSEVKGKYILLDFSATFCVPCIESVKDLKKLSTLYADSLQIITYSADGGKSTWLTGVKRDHPTWLSLWDGKGPYGEAQMKYGVNGVPTFVLINPQGKIVANWSGYGTNADGSGTLETELKKYLPAN